jgi:hypothetical protein
MSVPINPIPFPDVSRLVTEDDTPVDIYSEKQQVLFRDPLYNTWRFTNGGRPFVAMANVGLFYAVKKPAIVPDGLLSLDVELPDDLMLKEHRSYFMWEYGKPPELAFEVVSNDVGEELGEKTRLYARIGVLYYVVWDPERILAEKPLHVFELRRKKYEPLSGAWFPEIGLGMTVWHGTYEDCTNDWLRWSDEHGQVLPTGKERADLAEEHATRAEEHATRAEERAIKAEERAARLAAQLRAMGLEPEE